MSRHVIIEPHPLQKCSSKALRLDSNQQQSAIIMTMAQFIAAVLCLLYASMIHHVYGQSGGSECTTPYALRLEQAESFTSEPFSAFSGRLEMCYCSGNMVGSPDDCMWRVVNSGSPTVPWSWKNVQVACRQLARDTGARFTGQGNPIILTS
jgi:hypothetical protein